MSTVESVDKMIMTTSEANGHLEEVMHKGTDVTSDDSVCNDSPRITTGYYLSHAGCAIPPCSPLMHHRPVNIEYVPVHRSSGCQSYCCSSAQFCGQIPQPYGHPVAPCPPVVGGLCTYAASSSADQAHPQHPPPPAPIMYPPILPSMFAAPCGPGCCPHHGPFAAPVQPIPFASCSMELSQQKTHGRVESPLVSTSDTSNSVSLSDTSSKVGKLSEDELTTKENDEATGQNGMEPLESAESLQDASQPVSQRYVSGAKLEKQHGRTPLFGDTPSWWNQEDAAESLPKQTDCIIGIQENEQPTSSALDEDLSPEAPVQKKQEPSAESAPPEVAPSTYKPSVRMDIPFAPAAAGKANPKKESCPSSDSHKTAAFTIQFNEDQSTNMVAIGKEATRSCQTAYMPRGKLSATKPKIRKAKPIEVVPVEAPVNEHVDDDAVSECGTYTVDDERSYVNNKQLYEADTACESADGRNTLLKELIKISTGDPATVERQRKVGARQGVATSKSGPSSPITRRTNSASQIVHSSKGAIGSSQTAQNFRRSDGGRFSMRSKVTMSPGRNITTSTRSYAGKSQEVRPETLAWLRRKEYNPLKSANGVSTRGSTSSDTKLLNNRSKSFHASSHRSSTPSRRQEDTTTKEGAKPLATRTTPPSPSSLRGQVFVQLGSLKRIQMLSVDLMTSASGLKEKIRDTAGRLDDVEEDTSEGTSIGTDCPCPLSDVIKKLTIVDKTLRVTERLVNQMLSQSNPPVGNESTV